MLRGLLIIGVGTYVLLVGCGTTNGNLDDPPMDSDSAPVGDTASESASDSASETACIGYDSQWSTGDNGGDSMSEDDSGNTDSGGDTSASESGSDSAPPVPCQSAIITDIDETLTTSDGEWLKKVLMPSYDPAMRPDANTLMQGYAALGYHVFYLSARGELLSLLDGTSARDATRSWLEAHGFPFEQGDLFLAPGIAALDDAAATYKQGKIEELMDDGWSIAYAYGNALTDIEAYKGAGIPDERIFLVGKLAGQQGVVPLPTSQAYSEHLDAFLPTVPPTDCF